MEDIEDLRRSGFPVYPGALGENLTTTGLDMRAVRFGDRFRSGSGSPDDFVLEITKLRQPCRTLNSIKKGIQTELFDRTPGSPRWGRGGFYAKVIQPGIVRVGAIIAKADHDV